MQNVENKTGNTVINNIDSKQHPIGVTYGIHVNDVEKMWFIGWILKH